MNVDVNDCKRTLQYPLAELEKMMTSLKFWRQSGIRDMLQHARAKRVDTREKIPRNLLKSGNHQLFYHK